MTRDLADVWTWFADTSCRDYSPLYDRICRRVADDEQLLELIQSAPAKGHQPNVLLAAVHDLLLAGLDHPLAAVYAGESDAHAGELFADLCLSHREEIVEMLATRHTNTNEVGRAALLGPALTAAARSLGGPIGLIDVGCSAGLNLLCDRYLLDYGVAGQTGPHDAAVRIKCEVAGGQPPIEPMLPEIAWRAGLNHAPVRSADEREARWLLACIWPDTGRLPRAKLALDEARGADLDLRTGDAVAAVRSLIGEVPAGVTPIVMTTWALMYLAKDERVRFRDELAEASKERPLGWITADSPGVVDLLAGIEAPFDGQGMQASVLGLTTFRNGAIETTTHLGFVHPHGNWIDWRA